MKLFKIKKTVAAFLMTVVIGVLPIVNVHAQDTAGKVPQAESTAQKITPKKKVTVKINKDKISINKNHKAKLKVFKTNAPAQKIIWSSNKKSVAKVDQQGNITAKSKGIAVITAKVQGTNIKDTCEVEVQNYKVMRMRTTGYCNCRRCAGKWAGQPTASGRKPRANHTIAVDRRLIKLGTKVQIGNTIYTAEDTGGAIKGHRIDVYYSSHRKATRHGVKYQLVKVFY